MLTQFAKEGSKLEGMELRIDGRVAVLANGWPVAERMRIKMCNK